MELLPDEKVLLLSDDNELTLTTHRVRLESQSLGRAQIISIMLEELASCSMTRVSHPIFLILAGVSIVIGAVVASNGRGNEGALTLGLVAAVVFVILYFANRQQIIALASAGATINVNTQGMNPETVRAFINRAETAKNARYLLRC